MQRSEMVTDFKLYGDGDKPITVSQLIKGAEKHLKPMLDGEVFCDCSTWNGPSPALPERWRSLIAFAVDGDNEGYYVHVGVMVCFGTDKQHGEYIDAGFVKLWTPEHAQRIATEAQRFLSAARWN